MTNIHYKDDLNFLLKGNYEGGQPLVWPDYDWIAKFYTISPVNSVCASVKDGVPANCFEDGGLIHVAIDNPRLAVGKLMCEFTAFIPDSDMPDGIRKVTRTFDTDIVVTTEAVEHDQITIEVLLPLLKGDKGDAFTLDDFKATPTYAAIASGEAERVENEQARVSAEAQRAEEWASRGNAYDVLYAKTQEVNRNADEAYAFMVEAQSDEAARKEAEQERVAEEESRRSRERTRITAEQSRIENEASRVNYEHDRQSNETERVAAEEQRVNSENRRVDEEQTRYNNENKRKTSEDSRNSSEQKRKENEQFRIQNEEARKKTEAERAEEFAGFADAITAKQDKLSVSEDLALSEDAVLSLTDRAKQRLFDDMWLQACDSYGSIDHTHYEDGVLKPYYLNELWLTYEEAMDVFYAYSVTSEKAKNYYMGNKKIKTNLPARTKSASEDFTGTFYSCYNIEIANVPISAIIGVNTFTNCSKLRKISNSVKSLGNGIHKSFIGCKKLEQLEAAIINGGTYSLQDSPLINFNSIKYIIEHTNDNLTVSITLHHDVYAKITEPTNPDYEQWHPLLALAESKNISLATV